MDDVEGNDVQHLVADHHAADLLGQRVDPLEPPDVLGEAPCDEGALALAQLRAHLEQPVAPGRLAHGLQLAEEVHHQALCARRVVFGLRRVRVDERHEGELGGDVLHAAARAGAPVAAAVVDDVQVGVVVGPEDLGAEFEGVPHGVAAGACLGIGGALAPGVQLFGREEEVGGLRRLRGGRQRAEQRYPHEE